MIHLNFIFSFVQYISTWTVVNGAVIVAGLGFAKTEEGVNWNALANIKLRKYWTARSFDDMIRCFNINTNDVKIYHMCL